MESFWMKSRHLKTRPVLKFPQKNKRQSVAWPLKFKLLKSNVVSSWRVLSVFSWKKFFCKCDLPIIIFADSEKNYMQIYFSSM